MKRFSAMWAWQGIRRLDALHGLELLEDLQCDETYLEAANAVYSKLLPVVEKAQKKGKGLGLPLWQENLFENVCLQRAAEDGRKWGSEAAVTDLIPMVEKTISQLAVRPSCCC